LGSAVAFTVGSTPAGAPLPDLDLLTKMSLLKGTVARLPGKQTTSFPAIPRSFMT
jgi:hypothetical protein